MLTYGIPRVSAPPSIWGTKVQRSFPWDKPDLPTRRTAPLWSRLTVLADISSSSSGVVRHLEGFGASVHRKPIRADFAIGPLGIRRRLGRELAASVREGTLFRESILFARDFRHRLLVCEGEPGTPSTARAAWGAIQEVALKAEVPVLLTRSPVETAQLIMWVGRTVVAKAKPKRRTVKGARRCLGLAQKRVQILENLPNVGYVLAHNLLERFGVIRGQQLRVSNG
jgi:ERCC4-type nuclease